MAEFKESEHPRDKDGKFTDKDGKKSKKEIKLKLLKSLEFFKDRNFLNIEIDKDYPKKVYGFANKKLLNYPDHFQRAKELGCKNQTEYENYAIEFWEKDDGEYFYSRARKRFYKYNRLKGLIAIANKDNFIHTFYSVTSKNFEKTRKWDDLVEI